MDPRNIEVALHLESMVAILPLAILVIACVAWGEMSYLTHSAEFSFAGCVISLLALLRAIEFLAGKTAPLRLAAFCAFLFLAVVLPNTIFLLRVVTNHFGSTSSNVSFFHLLLQLFFLVLAIGSLTLVARVARRFNSTSHPNTRISARVQL
jgi:hypothetical protein